MIPAHCPRILFFLGFGQNAAKLGVCKNPTLTGSLSVYYTPEHCLVNGGFLFFGGKSHVSNGQHVSFKEPCVMSQLRSICSA